MSYDLNSDNQSSQPESQQAESSLSAAERTQQARRRLIRGALASGPVILTLTSRPVLGTGGNCIAPSQTLSGALSHPDQQLGTCNGRSPGYWKTCSAASWPVPQSTRFHSIFSVGTQSGCAFHRTDGTSMSLIEVLSLDGTQDREMIAYHVIGAYLNILSGTVDLKALTVPKLQAIWTEWASSLKYTPYAGAVAWNGTQIKSYFINNFIAP